MSPNSNSSAPRRVTITITIIERAVERTRIKNHVRDFDSFCVRFRFNVRLIVRFRCGVLVVVTYLVVVLRRQVVYVCMCLAWPVWNRQH